MVVATYLPRYAVCDEVHVQAVELGIRIRTGRRALERNRRAIDRCWYYWCSDCWHPVSDCLNAHDNLVN